MCIRDSNKGCAIDTSVRLIQADGPSIDSAFAISEICDRQDGELTVFASGNGDMSYSLNAGTPQDSGRFTGLASGSYTITATDTNGCSLDTIITIDELVAPSIDSITTTATRCGSDNGSATVHASGMQEPLSFSLDPVSYTHLTLPTIYSV